MTKEYLENLGFLITTSQSEDDQKSCDYDKERKESVPEGAVDLFGFFQLVGFKIAADNNGLQQSEEYHGVREDEKLIHGDDIPDLRKCFSLCDVEGDRTQYSGDADATARLEFVRVNVKDQMGNDDDYDERNQEFDKEGKGHSFDLDG